MNSLKQVRSVFHSADMGMILIRMPGIERRIARFPQLYSPIGFVHESGRLAQPRSKIFWNDAGHHPA